jgi:TatD DNase family protein
MKIIDTHSHLNFNAYKEDGSKVIERCLEEGIWMINVGSQFTTSRRAVRIASNYPQGVYAAVGLHPIHLETQLVKIKVDPEEIEFETREEEFDYQKYKELAQNEKVVAIGEIGLDYYWRPKTKRKKEIFKEKQKQSLALQLKLARELNLPVIFHCRMAHDDLIKFLKENKDLTPKGGVAHGFVGTVEQLNRYLELGFYIGFNGIIFKSIEGIDFEENIKRTPLERMLVETDCPYLTPPQAGKERNEPAFIRYIIERIAEIKKESPERIIEETTKNARKLFNI